MSHQVARYDFEERIQVPVKKFSQSLYGNLVLAGGVVVRKISMRKQILQQCKNVFIKKISFCIKFLYLIFKHRLMDLKFDN